MERIDHPSRPAVCDAGPLIHLDELDGLDLLAGFREILVPSEVEREVSRHRPLALSSPTFSALPARIVEPPPVVFELRQLARAFSLDEGELAALALQSTLPEAILLSDDGAARMAAKALGRSVHGTLGLLARAVRLGLRSRHEALAMLDEMPSRSTLHVSPVLLAEVREQLRRRPH